MFINSFVALFEEQISILMYCKGNSNSNSAASALTPCPGPCVGLVVQYVTACGASDPAATVVLRVISAGEHGHRNSYNLNMKIKKKRSKIATERLSDLSTLAILLNYMLFFTYK